MTMSLRAYQRNRANREMGVPARGGRDGFTLIELMVAIVILVIMSGIIYSAFTNVTNTAAMARESAADLKYRQFIWRSFSVNMSSLYTEPSGESGSYRFVGTDDESGFGAADSLEFCTSLEMPGSTSMPGVLRTVHYSIIEAEEVEGEATGDFAIDAGTTEQKVEELLLEIYEAPLVVDEDEDDVSVDAAEFEEQAIVRRVPVRSMNITYYDDQAEEWVDDWDSTAEKRLPWAVRVQINLARSELQEDIAAEQGFDDGDSADIDMSFAIPIAAGVTSPFTDPNHMRQDLFQEDADSMFNEDGPRRQDGTPGR